MKVLVAMMSHETNTFSPVPTPLTRFGSGAAPLEGARILEVFRNRGSTMAGMLKVASEAGMDLVTPIAAGAPPSGRVDDDAYNYMTDTICKAAIGCDALLLDLHGAMVTWSLEDGEGELLARLRQDQPGIPIGVGLDMHANIYPAMVANATVIAGYHTYPHIDMFETGALAAKILFASLRGEAAPKMVWGNCPMLPHVMRQGTDDFPNKELQQRARELEDSGEALAVSLFTGFPHADIYNAGLSVVVVTDNDEAKAQQLRDELLQRAWDHRKSFVYNLKPLSESIAEGKAAAAAEGEGPVILLDHYDNTASGGTMDTTEVLREILNQGLDDVAVFGIFDPQAVDEMIAAGVGETVTVSLGGKFHMDALAVQSSPLVVTGTVRLISDGKFTVKGPMGTGSTMNMGHTVVLDTGKVQIIVISNHVEPYDLGCFSSLGIDPLSKTYLMLKSRIHYRATYLPIAKRIVECAGCGVCTSDYSQLTFENVRRPIYPLDNVNTWELAQGRID
ncbi:MAG: M81 family metallopeptidase [Pseudomonadales bacterium]